MEEKIAQTLVELLERFPYNEISVRILCESVPVSRQTFYHYFHSKDDVIQTYITQDFLKNAVPLFRYHLKEKGATAFFLYIADHYSFYYRIYEYDNGKFLEICLKNAYADIVKLSNSFSRNVEAKPDKIDPQVYSRYSCSGIAAVVVYWIQKEMNIPVEKIARDLYLMMEMPLGEVRDYYLDK